MTDVCRAVLGEVARVLAGTRSFAMIGAVAMARYDAATNSLKRIGGCASTCDLDEVPFLAVVASGTGARIVQVADLGPCDPCRDLFGDGAASMLMLPCWSGECFLGFVLFETAATDYFDDTRIRRLTLIAQALGVLLGREGAQVSATAPFLHSGSRNTARKRISGRADARR